MSSSLIQRLFSPTKTKKAFVQECSNLGWSCPKDELPPSAQEGSFVKTRLIFYRDCSEKRRKVYFDSETVKKVRIASDGRIHDDFRAAHGDVGFRYERQRADCKHIAEMVYGNIVSMSKSLGFRVHKLEAAGDTLWSLTFTSEPSRTASSASVHGDSCASFASSVGSFIGGSSASFKDMDKRKMSDPDSGIFSSLSSSSSKNGGNPSNPTKDVPKTDAPNEWDSVSNLQTRLRQQSLNSSSSSFRAIVDSPSSSMSSTRANVKSANDVLTPNRLSVSKSPLKKQGNIYAVAVITKTTPAHSKFLFENAFYLEAAIVRLKASCLRAFTCQQNGLFVLRVFEAFERLQNDIEDIFRLPRLDLSTFSSSPSEASTFAQLFNNFREELDTKESNFFFSNFLSGFLTHRLDWVRRFKVDEDAFDLASVGDLSTCARGLIIR